jgi:DNA-binding PadR family transcriptional regulator
MFHEFWHHPGGPHGHGPWHAARRGGWGPGPGGGRRGRGGPAEWFGDFFGPPARAERGEVRYLVLDAIEKQARHGYEIIQAIGERSGGAYRPSPGVIYPTLQMLEELGHARVVEQDARKVYAITENGVADLGAHRDEVTDFYERFHEESWERHIDDFNMLMLQVAKLLKTFKRASRRGQLSNKAKSSIREILDDALKRIEDVLRNDDV